jgi:hypothetical protein
MPILTKPCKGKLSEQTQLLLGASRESRDWVAYPCEICNQSVGVSEVNGKWVTERHWPSVVYTPRKPSAGRYMAKAVTPAKLRMRPH